MCEGFRYISGYWLDRHEERALTSAKRWLASRSPALDFVALRVFRGKILNETK